MHDRGPQSALSGSGCSACESPSGAIAHMKKRRRTRESKAEAERFHNSLALSCVVRGGFFLRKKPRGVCGAGCRDCGPAVMPKNRCAVDLPLDHRRYERNLEIARKVGWIRGSGRTRDLSESNERHGTAQQNANFTMIRDGEHNGA